MICRSLERMQIVVAKPSACKNEIAGDRNRHPPVSASRRGNSTFPDQLLKRLQQIGSGRAADGCLRLDSGFSGSGLSGSGITDSGIAASGIAAPSITASGITDSDIAACDIAGSGITASDIITSDRFRIPRPRARRGGARRPTSSHSRWDHAFAYEQLANGPETQASLILEHPDPEEQIEKGERISRPGSLLAGPRKKALSDIIMNRAGSDPGPGGDLVDDQTFGTYCL